MLNLRGNQAPGIPNMGDSQAGPPSSNAGLGGFCNEEIRVPDKMVGLSKCELLFIQK